MRILFMDTSYLVGLLNPRDQIHELAKKVSAGLGPCKMVTSEMVLAEALNGLADKGEKIRMAAVAAVIAIRNQASTKVFPQTSALFNTAFDLYRERIDKDWGLVDCASFAIMKQEGIAEALTADKDFEQAGFKALLRSQ